VIIICPTCNAKYRIPQEKISMGKRITAQCKKCGGRIEIEPIKEQEPLGTAQTEEASTPIPSPPSPTPSHAAETGEFQFMPREQAFAGYAGFWKRLWAAIIDGVLLMVVSFMLVAFLALLYRLTTGTSAGAGVLGNIIGGLVSWLYYAIMESSYTQGTLGKMALGIQVTDLSGNPISFARATGRHFGKLISTLIVFIGYLMVAFTAKKQGLHDMLAGCLVVKRK
jgi:predicted Zn finger-like uncharacterized protein